MKYNERLIYTSNSGSIEISYFSPYTPRTFYEGLGNSIVSAKNNTQDGESYLSSSLNNRTLSIEGFFKLNKYNVLERKLRHVCNPKLPGILSYTDGVITRTIDVHLEAMPRVKRNGRIGEFYIDLIAYDPFWKDGEKLEELAVLIEMGHFPLVIPPSGFIFGAKKAVKDIAIENIGDVAAGFRIVFRAKDGLRNPYLKNEDTGKQIKLSCELSANDIVEIRNYPYEKSIALNGKRDFSILNRTITKFFELEPGLNKISYGADENAGALDVAIYYKPLYLGV